MTGRAAKISSFVGPDMDAVALSDRQAHAGILELFEGRLPVGAVNLTEDDRPDWEGDDDDEPDLVVQILPSCQPDTVVGNTKEFARLRVNAFIVYHRPLTAEELTDLDRPPPPAPWLADHYIIFVKPLGVPICH